MSIDKGVDAAASQVEAGVGARRREGSNWLLLSVGSIIVALTAALSMLGYGATLAGESDFGIPGSTVYGSPIELPGLSSIAIMGFLDLGVQGLASAAFYSELFKSSSWLMWLGVAFLVILFIDCSKHVSPEPVCKCVCRVCAVRQDQLGSSLRH
jgi:hypothetical protein